MPAPEHHRLYDIKPLLPHLEAGAVLLTPNIRLARHVRGEWDRYQAASGLRAWPTLPVHALDHWLQRCWERAVGRGDAPPKTVLDAPRIRELWLQVIEEELSASGDYSLLQPLAAAELAAQARDNLLRWQVDTGNGPVRDEFALDADCGTYLRWLDRFEQRLDAQDLATPVDCAQDLLAATVRPEESSLILLDFDDIPPLYRACLGVLGADIRELQSGAGEAEVRLLSCTDQVSELEAVARWASQLHREQKDATLGIVLADMNGDRQALEYLLRREFDCLGEDYTSLPVNFSTGISLDRAPVVRDALRMLETAGPRIALKDIQALLDSRFSQPADGDRDLAITFLARLYDNGQKVVDTGYLRAWAVQVGQGEAHGLYLADKLQAMSRLRLHHKKQTPSAWIEDLSKALECWGWPGPGPLDSLEYQQVELWYESLDRFASYDHVMGRVDLGSALSALRRHCQAQVSQPRTVEGNIQVLGPLEATGLSFDELWLVGLQASRWPPSPRPSPFLPMALQRRREMPHASSDREWRFAQTLMRQYRGNCSRVTASYRREIDGVPELPSPLLAGWPSADATLPPEPPAHWMAAREGRALERVDDDTAPPLAGDELARLRGGSGILEDQANCPFRAYARRRLGLEALADFRNALSAAERGTILHDALYTLWGELEDSDHLMALDDAGARALARRAAQSAVDEVPSALRQLVGQPSLDLERERLEVLLLEWLDVERERPPFAVHAREEPLDAELLGIPLRLRVDRVDRLPDGQLVLIDYKSGRNSLKDWLGERPASPQLPLYGIAGEPVSALAFAEVRSRECRLLALGNVEGESWIKTDIGKAVGRYTSADSWTALMQEWRSTLGRLAQSFLDGEASVDPLPNACNYCGMQSLCRVDLQEEEA